MENGGSHFMAEPSRPRPPSFPVALDRRATETLLNDAGAATGTRFRRRELQLWRMKTRSSGGPLVNRQAGNLWTALGRKIGNSLDKLGISGMAGGETGSML